VPIDLFGRVCRSVVGKGVELQPDHQGADETAKNMAKPSKMWQS
jgi:hypothetical protein